MENDQKRQRGRPRAFNPKTEQNMIQSLDRALMILKKISDQDGVSLSELSELSDQSPATVYRALITLQAHDIVGFEEEGQLWHVGPGAFQIGSRFLRRSNILQRSQPIMRDLMRETGETANLGIERNDQVLFISQAETHETIRAFFPPGSRNHMHSSGIGKALLAYFDPARLKAIIDKEGLIRFTDKTITDADTLEAELAKVRKSGFAVDDEERTDGMRCIAAPVFNVHGEPFAGLSVSGPSFRIPMNATPQIGRIVRQAADSLTQAIGGRPMAAE